MRDAGTIAASMGGRLDGSRSVESRGCSADSEGIPIFVRDLLVAV